MAIINFEHMKATEPDRNFDNVNVDENYNIGLQNGQGFYGAGKFFGLVQKAVNWISTITGNKNFTGTLSVNSKEVATTESVNNALANYVKIKTITTTKTTNSSGLVTPELPNATYYIILGGYCTNLQDKVLRFGKYNDNRWVEVTNYNGSPVTDTEVTVTLAYI